MNPYGVGNAAVTATSILRARRDESVNVSPLDIGDGPSMNIIADEDDITVTLRPNGPATGGAGVPSGLANIPLGTLLDRGQVQNHANLELIGSVIQIRRADRAPCRTAAHALADERRFLRSPRANGPPHSSARERVRRGDLPSTHERARLLSCHRCRRRHAAHLFGERRRPIDAEPRATSGLSTAEPFVVASQDADHPFMLVTYMTSSCPR